MVVLRVVDMHRAYPQAGAPRKPAPRRAGAESGRRRRRYASPGRLTTGAADGAA